MKSLVFILMMFIWLAISANQPVNLPPVYNTGTQVSTVITNNKGNPAIGIDSVFTYYTDLDGINTILGKVKYQPHKSGKWMGFDYRGGAGIMAFINIPNKENNTLLTGVPYKHVYKIGAKINGELRQLIPCFITYNESKEAIKGDMIALPMDLYHVHINSESVGEIIELVKCPFLQWQHTQMPVKGTDLINIKTTLLPKSAINIYTFYPKYLYGATYKIAPGYDSKIKTGGSFYYQNAWYQRCVIVGNNDTKKGIIQVEITGKDYTGATCTFVYTIKFEKAK